MAQHEEFYTADIYCAAALDCFGIKFLRAAPMPDGRIGFWFDNAEDKAFQTAREYRTDGWMMVPVLKFKDDVRFLSCKSHAARQALRTEESETSGKRTA